MITFGADVHLKTSTITALDDSGEKLVRKRLSNDPDELLTFIRQFHGPKQFSMETCYNWPVVYELMKDEVDIFNLLHARRLKSIVESQSKCDAHDSDEIAYLTHIGRIPKAHTASADTRQFRRLLRTRVGISFQIAEVKNKIHAVVNTNTFYSQRPQNFKNLFCKRGLAFLETVQLPESERHIITELLKEIRFLEKLRARFDAYIEEADFHSADLVILQTAPAMGGKIFKYIVLSEIDTIHRFRNSDAIIAYAGLVPKDRSSGDKIRKGCLRSECNQFLRWAMIEAVIPAIRRDRSLRRYYMAVKARRNSSAAKIATARRLLTIIYHMLKDRKPYFVREQKPQITQLSLLPSPR